MNTRNRRGPGARRRPASEAGQHLDVGLDLQRIDLSLVVSKYIGETEKNLARVFDYAERASAIILFDEAESLFGKGGEVRDAHDRFANRGIAFLLQRIEEYDGLAILTTNAPGQIDPAFRRWFAALVYLPIPDEAALLLLLPRSLELGIPTGRLKRKPRQLDEGWRG